MIALLVALAANLAQPGEAEHVMRTVGIGPIEGALLQQTCEFWIDEDEAPNFDSEMEAFAMACLEVPMASVEEVGTRLEDQLASSGWAIWNAMGYSSVYHREAGHPCLSFVAVSLMTKDRPTGPDDRRTAETAVLLLMVAEEELTACN